MVLLRVRNRSTSEGKRPSRFAAFLAILVVVFFSVVFLGQQFLTETENATTIPTQSTFELEVDDITSGSGMQAETSGSPSSDVAHRSPEQHQVESSAQGENLEIPENPLEHTETDLVISGTVLDDRGQPLEGATVVARRVSQTAREEGVAEPEDSQQTSTTNQVGSFEIRNLGQGEYELNASKGDGYVPASLKVRAGVANAELILAGKRSVVVHGQITDDFGYVLGNVQVRVLGSHSPVRSNSDGNYEILVEQISAGKSPVLDFSLEGFEKMRKRVEPALDPGSDQVRIDVQMKPESDAPTVALGGQVMGPTGELVGGVIVWLRSSKTHTHLSTTTNEAGEFDFTEVETGSGYRLGVEQSEDYAAYQSEEFSVDREDALHKIMLEGAEFSDLTATVTNLTGQPLAGFTLWVRGVGKGAQPPTSVQTDVSGRFQLEQIRAGEIAIESRSQPKLKATKIVLKAGEHNYTEIPMDWGDSWLLGRIVNTRGQPVSGARVVVTWEERFWNVTSHSRREATSDLEGFFAVSNLGAQNYTLMVGAPGHQSKQFQYRLAGDSQELQVQLPESSTSGAENGGG